MRKAQFSQSEILPGIQKLPRNSVAANPDGDSAPHTLANMPSACWFAALTAWLRHEGSPAFEKNWEVS